MVKIRLKSAHDAVIKMLKSKTFNSISVDRISDRNDAIISDLFRRTEEGVIKGFYLMDKTNLKALMILMFGIFQRLEIFELLKY